MSFSESLILRIVSMFEMFIVSILGVGFPFLYSLNNPNTDVLFKLFRLASSGLILSVGVVHLLSDAQDSFYETGQRASLANMLCLVGVFLVLLMDQVASILLADKGVEIGSSACDQCNSEINNDVPHSVQECELNQESVQRFSIEFVEEGEECHSDFPVCSKKSKHSKCIRLNTTVRDDSHHSGSHGGGGCEGHMKEITNVLAINNGSFVKVFLLEFSISDHSLILGFSIGILSSKSNLFELKVLMIAIGIHQFFEGVGLGTVLSDKKLKFSTGKIASFVCLFAGMVSIGVFLGIMTASNMNVQDSDELSWLQGILNSIAAGMLMYISLVDLLAEELQDEIVLNNPRLRLTMLCSFFLGCGLMTVLGVWA